MSRSSNALVGGAVLLSFFVSLPFSYSLLRGRTAAGSRGGSGEAGGLLVAVSRKPALTLGFRNLVADLIWLEAVQVAGNLRMPPREYDRLFVLLNATADIDPMFEIPYLLGGLVLGESPGHASEALHVLERGRRQRPGNWLFPFYIGYTRYFSLGDPIAGGHAMAEAARLPDSPAYLARLAARMLAEGRDPEAALAFLGALIREEADGSRREILKRRFKEVTVERDIQALERAVEAYRAARGRSPAALAELVTGGILPGLPREPNGGSYLLYPDGTIRSDVVERRLKVFKR